MMTDPNNMALHGNVSLRRVLAAIDSGEPSGGLRRQDLPPVYIFNAALYFLEGNRFLQDRQFPHPETVGYAIPAGGSVHLDTAADMAEAERRLANLDDTLPEPRKDTLASGTDK